jgi:NAD(P)-dependent dehydrogenase (short-subunit alcohol dehydrogenase family)
MQNILVTGANRGIGLALVEQYLAVGGCRIFASCRNPEAASALNAMAEANPQTLRTLQLDVDDETSIKRAVDTIGADSDRLDALINNAGVSGGGDTRNMGQLNSVAVAAVITTNAVAPLIVTQACRDLLKQADNPRVVMISSGLGSLARADGSAYAYRMSKAAMNMAARVLAFDDAMAGITTVTMAPGWVRTDMGGPSANLAPEESASALLAVIEKLDASDNGGFYRYDGMKMDW